MEKSIGCKQSSEAIKNLENDYTKNTSEVPQPKAVVPRLKPNKMNNDRLEKRVYRIVLTGGKLCDSIELFLRYTSFHYFYVYLCNF